MAGVWGKSLGDGGGGGVDLTFLKHTAFFSFTVDWSMKSICINNFLFFKLFVERTSSGIPVGLQGSGEESICSHRVGNFRVELMPSFSLWHIIGAQ